MGFQRSVWGSVGRKKLEAKLVTSSRSVVVMGIIPCAQEWFWVSFFQKKKRRKIFCSLEKIAFVYAQVPLPLKNVFQALVA